MKFKISLSRLGKGLVRVRGRSDDGERHVNLYLSLTLVDVKLVLSIIFDQSMRYFILLPLPFFYGRYHILETG